MPGFWPALGFTLTYLSAIVLIPLMALVLRPLELGWSGIWEVFSDDRVVAALRLSFLASFAAALTDGVLGFIVAWTLVRYKFPGRRILDALVDLPFAMPTAVAGISLATIYAPTGWIGALFDPFGIKIAYTPIGVFVALVFVGFPFVVRAVQPVLEDFEREVEEAAATLGARRRRTFVQVIFPAVAPALLTGFTLALARSVGEYGSVIFIAGNLPYVSEIAPLVIVMKLEEYNYAGAAAVGLAMLLLSFLILLVSNAAQVALSKGGKS
ncbi:MAG: sulfate ABC transporter permease subunit CysT [Caulobacterales bacterium]